MAHDVHTHVKTQTQYEYSRRKAKNEMQGQVTTFAIMIFLTLIAFTMVHAGFSSLLVTPIILLLAAVQVVLQLYYFMHMSHKGHGTAQFFIFSGALVAFITVLTFVTIIWW
ncbi:cytochrome c oxidase subunit IVB [Paenisporosarcina cavernae]|uniref:Cytochrome c oxidase subunit IVB n=1 Tax=Paenisporosarcina cavernae TaxID=2320858 RepID=A0A385YTX6_9BACL|nr:cytochrome c oxidase subunit IVB [Paenisporosarcina cavernae]AYC29128.1 cytochrome c oxidase subunit IVB [Paenisporosarcina cavernae]